MKSPVAFVVAIGAFGASVAATAHHSFAMYSYSEQIALSGSVKDFKWGNPHLIVHLTSPDANGNSADWSLEGASVNVLVRHGWARDSIKLGDKVTIWLNPLKTGEPGGSILKVKLANGKELDATSGLANR